MKPATSSLIFNRRRNEVTNGSDTTIYRNQRRDRGWETVSSPPSLWNVARVSARGSSNASGPCAASDCNRRFRWRRVPRDASLCGRREGNKDFTKKIYEERRVIFFYFRQLAVFFERHSRTKEEMLFSHRQKFRGLIKALECATFDNRTHLSGHGIAVYCFHHLCAT